MPRVRLKGIHRNPQKLADGRIVTYWYAWRGGPRLIGEPGSPEFIASFNEAISRKAASPQAGTLSSVLDKYEASEEAFGGLGERTKKDYRGKIKLIRREFGSLPLGALTDPKVRGVFLEWRDRLAKESNRQADYAWSVLALILAWAHGRRLVGSNPCEKGGRLYNGSRANKIWTDDQEKAFLAAAPPHMHLPFLLAIWTAQRQGDQLRAPWSTYDGKYIRLKQSKTGRYVIIPVGAPLKQALDAAKALRGKATTILVNSSSPGPVTVFARPGGRPARRPASPGSRSMIFAAAPSRAWRSRAQRCPR